MNAINLTKFKNPISWFEIEVSSYYSFLEVKNTSQNFENDSFFEEETFKPVLEMACYSYYHGWRG